MPEEPKLKSANSFKSLLGGLLAAGLFALVVSCLLYLNFNDGPYIDIPGTVFATVFGLVGVFCFVSIARLDTIQIYTDRMEAKFILGFTTKVIRLEDIRCYAEVEKKDKSRKWHVLIIYTDNASYRLQSNLYKNYHALKVALVKGKKEDWTTLHQNKRKLNIAAGVLLLVLAVLAFYGTYHVSAFKNGPLQADELVGVKGIIVNKPEVHYGRKSSYNIPIYLKQYPQFQFQVAGSAFSVTRKQEYLNEVQKGDMLHLAITREDFYGKLTKQEELGFWDKHVNYRFIHVYELCEGYNCFLTLKNYNLKSKDKSSDEATMLFIIGCLLTGSGLWQLKKD